MIMENRALPLLLKFPGSKVCLCASERDRERERERETHTQDFLSTSYYMHKVAMNE